MAFKNPYRQHNYMGEYANDGAALTYIQTVKWDSTKDGTGTPEVGMWYYNTALNLFKMWNGTAWYFLVIDNPLVIRQDGSVAFTADQSMGNNKLTNVATPTLAGDAATKSYVDALFQGLDWQESVIDKDLATPPVSPTLGDRYIIASGGTGAWSGHDFKIAEWNGTSWDITTPDEGFAGFVEDEGIVYLYNAPWDSTDHWVKFGTLVSHNNLAGLQGGTSNEYYHLTNTQHQALTSAGGVGNASTEHIHDDRYYTETELGSTTPASEGASLIGTDTKTNLASATTVEAALTELDTRNPPARKTNAGNPNGVVAGAVGDLCVDTTNDIVYANVDGTNTGWMVLG